VPVHANLVLYRGTYKNIHTEVMGILHFPFAAERANARRWSLPIGRFIPRRPFLA